MRKGMANNEIQFQKYHLLRRFADTFLYHYDDHE